MTAPTLEGLQALDAADSLRDFRARFRLRDGLIYLDGNSLGPLPLHCAERISECVQSEWAQGLITSWLGADWVNAPTRIGDKIGRLIGAQPGEVIAADSTSMNIFKALGAACGINRDRNVVLSEAGNFPTDLYVMEGVRDVSAGRIDNRVVAPENVLDALGPDVAVLLLTQVHYKTGRIRDLADVTRRAHAAGALVVWDLSHSAGSIEVDLTGANADFAVGCGYKFLNGGPGAPAYLYVARRHQQAASSPTPGWFGHREPFAFRDDFEPADGVRRFLCGTPPILGLTALECGVDLMLEADMTALRSKARRLGATFIELMDSCCAGHGFELISPRDDDERGSQVSFRHPQGYEIMQALKDRDIIGDFRAPDILRFGMTPLYLRFEDVWHAAHAIADIVESGAWDRAEYKTRQAVT